MSLLKLKILFNKKTVATLNIRVAKTMQFPKRATLTITKMSKLRFKCVE